jgi:isoleucyl-tRNA synthetase
VQVIADEVNVKEVAMKHAEAVTTEHGEETFARVPVVLDTTITPQLKKEGQIRELMRAIQDMRKEAGLEPKDRVVLTIGTTDEGVALIEQFTHELTRVVGATDVVFGPSDAKAFSIDELSFTVHVQKV